MIDVFLSIKVPQLGFREYQRSVTIAALPRAGESVDSPEFDGELTVDRVVHRLGRDALVHLHFHFNSVSAPIHTKLTNAGWIEITHAE